MLRWQLCAMLVVLCAAAAVHCTDETMKETDETVTVTPDTEDTRMKRHYYGGYRRYGGYGGYGGYRRYGGYGGYGRRYRYWKRDTAEDTDMERKRRDIATEPIVDTTDETVEKVEPEVVMPTEEETTMDRKRRYWGMYGLGYGLGGYGLGYGYGGYGLGYGLGYGGFWKKRDVDTTEEPIEVRKRRDTDTMMIDEETENPIMEKDIMEDEEETMDRKRRFWGWGGYGLGYGLGYGGYGLGYGGYGLGGYGLGYGGFWKKRDVDTAEEPTMMRKRRDIEEEPTMMTETEPVEDIVEEEETDMAERKRRFWGWGGYGLGYGLGYGGYGLGYGGYGLGYRLGYGGFWKKRATEPVE